MVSEFRHAPEPDLDRTDRLPMLPGTVVAPDVADDAVPMEPSAVADSPAPTVPSVQGVRSGQERIERRRFGRSDTAFEAPAPASVPRERAGALTADLAAARSALQTEQARSTELDRLVAERNSALAVARSRIEGLVREAERNHQESSTLRESLASREAALVQAARVLSERDAELSALQEEHSKIVAILEAAKQSASQLEAELQGLRADANALAAQLHDSRQTAAALIEQRTRSESDMAVLRSDAAAARAEANSYLDLLRTREWRRGFVLNLIRDGEAGATHADPGTLQAHRGHAPAKSEAPEVGAASGEAAGAPPGEAQVSRLLEAEQQRVAQQAAEITQLRTEQGAQRQLLQSEAEKHEQEIAVLMAHLQEARRPIESIEADLKRLGADVKRLTQESSAKSAAISEYEDENRRLRSTLVRTRGALEEREFLISRLQHDEHTANGTGRVQPGTAWQGSAAVDAGAAAETRPADWAAELIRIDDERAATYVLAPRTRIGRAVSCELHLDASSVSRQHALVVVGPREAVIEDLDSTNGVLVNGRKVARHVLCDGDSVTIGEIHFRYAVRSIRPSTKVALGDPAPADPASGE